MVLLAFQSAELPRTGGAIVLAVRCRRDQGIVWNAAETDLSIPSKSLDTGTQRIDPNFPASILTDVLTGGVGARLAGACDECSFRPRRSLER